MTHLDIPSVSNLNRALTELTKQGGIPAQVLKKAHFALLNGLRIEIVEGGFRVPSFSECETYTTTLDTCTCKSRLQPCKHRAILLLLSQAHSAPAPERIIEKLRVRGITVPREGVRQSAAQSSQDLFG